MNKEIFIVDDHLGGTDLAYQSFHRKNLNTFVISQQLKL
jgi:hypothetical protein